MEEEGLDEEVGNKYQYEEEEEFKKKQFLILDLKKLHEATQAHPILGQQILHSKIS